jgi:hypothetical protein
MIIHSFLNTVYFANIKESLSKFTTEGAIRLENIHLACCERGRENVVNILGSNIRGRDFVFSKKVKVNTLTGSN